MAMSTRASDVIDCAYMYMNIHTQCVMLARAMHYNRGGCVWMCSKILFLMSAVLSVEDTHTNNDAVAMPPPSLPPPSRSLSLSSATVIG